MAKSKVKTVFVCQECGFESPKWLGKCTSCGSWNTMTEEIVTPSSPSLSGISEKPVSQVVPINQITASQESRVRCGIGELDRVLGGGLVLGSLVLVGGDPGIGKSTLLLQCAKTLSAAHPVLYASGEESQSQIKLRADRLGAVSDTLYLYCETDIDRVISAAHKLSPVALIVDSIQTMYTGDINSVPGSVSQVRECCLRLMKFAKTENISVFVVGHVTKEGTIAGPRILEHMVDSVLYFEGERHQAYRILRAVKNRFGSTDEIGVFEMKDRGLQEVENPSLMLLAGRPKDTPGSAVVCSMEGTRPILAEIQALISPTGFGTPRRMTTGIDYNRATMLLAVVEKRLHIPMQNQDAYINVAGGLRLVEPAADLALILAVLSGFQNLVLPDDLASIGEVGLTGEIRSITHVQRRVSELEKLGFHKCILPRDNMDGIKTQQMSLYPVSNVGEVMEVLRSFAPKNTPF